MSFTASQNYGKYNHTLTEDELPSHSHTTRHYIQGNPQWDSTIRNKTTVVTRYCAYFPDNTISHGSTGYTIQETNNVISLTGAPTTFTGRGKPHNNIQPSICVYFWMRIA